MAVIDRLGAVRPDSDAVLRRVIAVADLQRPFADLDRIVAFLCPVIQLIGKAVNAASGHALTARDVI